MAGQFLGFFICIYLISVKSSAIPIRPQSLQPQSMGNLLQQLSAADQINNIVDALVGAGDFNSWANFLSLFDSSIFPLSATFFVPADVSLFLTGSTAGHPPGPDPSLLPYHIIPQRLSFSDLLQFNSSSRLPTLLPSKSIVITNSSADNFTLDGIRLSNPDLYATDSIVVHGIDSILDYSLYGIPNRKETASPTKDFVPSPAPASLPTNSSGDSGRSPIERPESNVGGCDRNTWVYGFLIAVVFYLIGM